LQNRKLEIPLITRIDIDSDFISLSCNINIDKVVFWSVSIQKHIVESDVQHHNSNPETFIKKMTDDVDTLMFHT
jgi:hypothetical protein